MRTTRGDLFRVGACLTLVTLLAGCRDATSPIDQGGEVPGVDRELPRRLTFSIGDDRSPAWSPSGDSVYYATPGFPPFPEAAGLLLSIPATGGHAAPLFPDVQVAVGVQRRFSTPAPSPAGDRMAYVELSGLSEGDVCPGAGAVQCTPAGTDPTAPLLQRFIVRVRPTGSTAPIDAEPSLRVSVEGQETIPTPPGASPPFQVRVSFHPFHQLFNLEGIRIFEPSWSPDGSRLVFSDGLQLLVWEVGSATPEPIPDTEDGVTPSWSPDGEWIAYSRLERGAPLNSTCLHFTPLGAACRQERVFWPILRRVVTLVRPDGSGRTELAEGFQPTWTPSGREIVFARAEMPLGIVSVDGGAVASVPGTDGGQDPAVSPDGTLVALSNGAGGGSLDIWVAALVGGQP